MRVPINIASLNHIINGNKTIEGRLNYSIFSSFKVNDIITFFNKNIECKTKIIKINYYSNLSDYLKNENLSNILPNVSNIYDAKNIYSKYYKKNKLNKYGFLAIYITPLFI